MKRLVIIVALMGVLPVLAYAVYDIACFQPQRSRIESVIRDASSGERAPPQQLIDMLRASSKDEPAIYAARLLIWKLDVLPEPHSMADWHLHYLLWWSLVSLHLSESEQITVVLTLAPTGHGRRGAEKAAGDLFGAPLSALSLDQCATIVALIKAPSYDGQPERLERARQKILEIYRAHGE